MEENQKKTNYALIFRVSQAFFAGLFTLGISLITGDLSSYAKMPISSISVTTTLFGLIGMIMSGYYAKKAENW